MTLTAAAFATLPYILPGTDFSKLKPNQIAGIEAIERGHAAIRLLRHGPKAILLQPKSKKPAGVEWQVTSDRREITAHLKRGANVGLLCGTDSGVAVLDFDDMAAYDAMQAELGPLPPTVRTGSGKVHVYFRWRPGLPAKVLWRGRRVGEVQRGPNQQVVCPPSVHPDTGQPYEWVNLAAPGPLPVRWDEAIGVEATASPKKTLTETAEDVERARRVARKKLDEEEAARSPELIFRKMSEVPDERIVKVFGGRLIQGAFGPMCGPGEAGKGINSSDIIARLTTGEPFPGETKWRDPMNVMVCVTEDSEARVKARLRAAGADLDRVISAVGPPVVRGGLVMPSPVKLDSDAGGIVAKARKDRVGAFWMETMLTHLGDREGKKQRSTNNEADVREALAPVIAICREAGLVGWGVMHPRKTTEGGIEDVISGSAAFRNIGRMTLHVYVDPSDKDWRLLFCSKANYLASRPDTLRFRIEPWDQDPDEGRVVWPTKQQGLVDPRSAEEIWRQIQDSKRVRRDHAVMDAERFLKERLAGGQVVNPKELGAEAKAAWLISPKALRNAKESLGVQSVKASFDGGWGWRLPPNAEGEM